MPTTSRGYPYFVGSDVPAGMDQQRQLAEAINDDIDSNLRALAWHANRVGGTADNFPASTFSNVALVALPSTAPAGVYLVYCNVSWATSSGAGIGFVRLTFGAQNLSGDGRADRTTSPELTSYVSRAVHAGGAVSVELALSCSVIGTVFLAGTSIGAIYLG